MAYDDNFKKKEPASRKKQALSLVQACEGRSRDGDLNRERLVVAIEAGGHASPSDLDHSDGQTLGLEVLLEKFAELHLVLRRVVEVSTDPPAD